MILTKTNSTRGALIPKSFDEKRFLENLLLDESRETYASMTKDQRHLLRAAYRFGWCDKAQELK